MSQDLRFAFRMLTKSKGTTSLALLTLALGIGASVTLFSLVDALYLRPLNVPDASRIVHGYQIRPENRGLAQLSMPDYLYYHDHAQAFDELAAHYPTSPLHVLVGTEPMAINGSVVTANYFPLLRITPALGRFFSPDEDTARDRDAVTVISYRFWQRQFGGDPQVLGKTIQINGRAFLIVGVAPRGFDGVQQGGAVSQVWIPSAMFRVGYRYCDAFALDCNVIEMLGRLRGTSTLADAQAEIDVLAGQLAGTRPARNRGIGVRLIPARGAHPNQRETSETVVMLLLGGVALLVLIACANVGGLLLARGSARRREVTIRLALGAGRGRVIRQFLTESVVLSTIGAALGLLVAEWGKEGVTAFYGVNYAGGLNAFDMAISGPVLAATVILCGATALLCGIAPALQAARTDIVPALKLESTSGGRPRSYMRDGLVVLQVAMSIVLLVGAGLLIRSMTQLYAGPKVDPDRIVLLRLRPSLVGYEAARARTFQRAVIERLEQMPGVEAAATAENLPLFGNGIEVTVESRDQGSVTLRARTSYVGNHYFDVLGLPLLAGRDFDSTDRPDTPAVAIVDEMVSASLGGHDRAVGRLITIDGEPHRIVGVARSAQYHSTTEPTVPYVYLNYWQQDGEGFAADSRTHVRVNGDGRAMLATIRREIAAIDSSVPISEDYPMRERVKFNFQSVRVAMTMLGGFGVFALILSSLGVYGVVAFVTAMRTREIAIRVALGADRAQVRRIIVGDGLRLAIPGAVVGIAAAFGAARLLGSLLYGVDPHDPGIFTAVPLLLVGVSLAATYLPLRRAVRVDPSVALRHE